MWCPSFFFLFDFRQLQQFMVFENEIMNINETIVCHGVVEHDCEAVVQFIFSIFPGNDWIVENSNDTRSYDRSVIVWTRESVLERKTGQTAIHCQFHNNLRVKIESIFLWRATTQHKRTFRFSAIEIFVWFHFQIEWQVDVLSNFLTYKKKILLKMKSIWALEVHIYAFLSLSGTSEIVTLNLENWKQMCWRRLAVHFNSTQNQWKDDRKAVPLYKIDNRNGNVQHKDQLRAHLSLALSLSRFSRKPIYNTVISTIRATKRLTHIDLWSNVRTTTNKMSTAKFVKPQSSLGANVASFWNIL